MTKPAREDRLKRLSPAKRALLVKAMRGEAKRSLDVSPIPRRGEQDVPQLSFAQQRLWFLDQLEPGKPYYNVSFALRLDQPLKLPALQDSLNEIVRRHEILRTTFATVDGRPLQVVAPNLKLTLQVIELSELPEQQRASRVRTLAAEEAQKPFDLSAGPLFRFLLLKTSRREHLLLPTFHHIVFDGWSIGILIQELAALYDAFSRGKPSPLPELPIQYADFAIWQRERLQGELVQQQLSYWKQQLQNAPPVIELPTDYARVADQSVRSASEVITLPAALSNSLQRLSRQENVTLFMTLLAAFQVLLHRYSGQTDIVVGSSIANRTRTEVEGLIGFFVNTLVLRLRFDGQPTFRELLQRVKNAAMGAYAHQDLPFERLVEELQPERSLGHTPLFQVMFALQNQPRLSLNASNITITPLEFESGAAKFDLTLVMIDTEKGLRTRMEYNAVLFQAQTIHRMLENFQTLLESIVTNSDRPAHSLPLLTPAARHKLLFEWNNTTRFEMLSGKCLHETFAEQAARTPERVAVVYEGEQLTYEALNRRSNQLAHYLRRLGVGPEITVGICCERSLEMIISLLGVLKAGGAYVPLDPATPMERLSFMIADSKARVLLTQSRLLPVMPNNEVDVVLIDEDWKRIERESEDDPLTRTNRENLAYVIFTSGSTGKPKGVAVEHRQVLNYLHSVTERLDFTYPATYAMVSTFAADLGHTMLFPSICKGGTLHIVSRERATDPEGLGQYFRQQHIDCLKIVPSHLAALMLSARPENILPRRHLVLGGEACRSDWTALINSLAPACRIFNHYGPTETTVGVLTSEVDPPGSENGFAGVPLGTPIANTTAYVLDPTLEPVPVGVKGEIYIGGAGVTRGYLNLPAMTAEKFIPDPFSKQSGTRLYRTGDIGRYLSSGKIEFLGRGDDQVKYHGYRIELEEIRSALKRHPQIRDGVVSLKKDKDGAEVLVAYYVSRQELEVSEIRSTLRECILEETIPSVFVHSRRMPLTLNGKVNYSALPSWDEARLKAHSGYIPPRTLTEEAVADVWRQVLGLQRVGVHDNFFELGGHSLLATRLISHLREAFQVNVPLRNLFERPTVEGLAENIAQLWGGREIAEEVVRVIKESTQLSADEINRVSRNVEPLVSQ